MEDSIGAKIKGLKDDIKNTTKLYFSDYLNDFFNLKLISRNELIILMGP